MKIYNKSDKSIIIQQLLDNKLCILPTDTVYGIMGLFNKNNEERINILKGRDKNQKISVIFQNKRELFKCVTNLSKENKEMMKDLLPGKYTFVVTLNSDYTFMNGFSRSDYGVRVTKNSLLQSIISQTGPLLATSCNLTKGRICITKEDIISDFSNTDIDVLYTSIGNDKASKIIDLTGEEVKTIRE